MCVVCQRKSRGGSSSRSPPYLEAFVRQTTTRTEMQHRFAARRSIRESIVDRARTRKKENEGYTTTIGCTVRRPRFGDRMKRGADKFSDRTETRSKLLREEEQRNDTVIEQRLRIYTYEGSSRVSRPRMNSR